MQGDADVFDRPRGPLANGLFGRAAARPEEGDEPACAAFGYLRGLHDRALGVELRFRDGNTEWHAYSHLGSWRYDPSVGLLLKFTGDLVSLVLIRGSNLDVLVNQGAVNLTDRGLARQRVTWVREMDEDALRQVGAGQPTIDRIAVVEFEAQDELRDWLKRAAPAFARGR